MPDRATVHGPNATYPLDDSAILILEDVVFPIVQFTKGKLCSFGSVPLPSAVNSTGRLMKPVFW